MTVRRRKKKSLLSDQGQADPFDFDVSGYPPLPRLPGLFITGTDTGVGKTLIAGAICRVLGEGGLRVEPFKPVATGCRRTREGLVSPDSEFLAACADSLRPLRQITPLRFKAAVAPNVAACYEHKAVELEAIFDEYRRLEGSADMVIVEGVGGLLCPLSDDFWVIHLARMMMLPVVIVARAGLGTINHTLLTIQVARQAGLLIAGVVVNRYRLEPETGHKTQGPDQHESHGDDDLAICTNLQQLAQRGKVPLLAIVPDEPSNSVERATLGPDTLFAVRQVNWPDLAR